MKLLMIRHPVTIANIAGVISNNRYGEIAEKGYNQINSLLQKLSTKPIDALYSSDADRCKVLAESIASFNGIKPLYSPLFREMNSGEHVDCKKEEITQRFMKDSEYKPLNGESLEDLSIRAEKGLDLIVKGNKNINLLVSHGWFLKMFLGRQLKMKPTDAIKYLKFSNCAISEIRLTDEGCIIEYLNNRDFLK